MSSEASAPSTGPTIRSNVATFLDLSHTIINVAANGTWMVTAGQPSNPPPTITSNPSPSGNSYTIEFDAGREASSAVADSYNALCGGQGHEWCTASATDSPPSELNFYFGLTLQLVSEEGGGPATVYLGQGSSGLVNNWWIGGEYVDNDTLKVPFGKKLITLSISPTADNGFQFNLVPIDDSEE